MSTIQWKMATLSLFDEPFRLPGSNVTHYIVNKVMHDNKRCAVHAADNRNPSETSDRTLMSVAESRQPFRTPPHAIEPILVKVCWIVPGTWINYTNVVHVKMGHQKLYCPITDHEWEIWIKIGQSRSWSIYFAVWMRWSKALWFSRIWSDLS